MARSKKQKGVPIHGNFTPILHDEMDSPAYELLSGNAAKLYGYMKRAARDAAHRNGVSERDAIFDFTYSEGKKHRFAERTMIRAIKELWAHGFIHVVERGGLRGAGRTNSKYRLCTWWQTYGVKDGWTNRGDHESDPFSDLSEPEERPRELGA